MEVLRGLNEVIKWRRAPDLPLGLKEWSAGSEAFFGA